MARYLTAMIRLDRMSGELSVRRREEALAALKVAVASALNPQDGMVTVKYTLREAGPDSKIYRDGFEISHALVDKKAGASPGSGRVCSGLRHGGPTCWGWRWCRSPVWSG